MQKISVNRISHRHNKKDRNSDDVKVFSFQFSSKKAEQNVPLLKLDL
jgi:hypothetical protein